MNPLNLFKNECLNEMQEKTLLECKMAIEAFSEHLNEGMVGTLVNVKQKDRDVILLLDCSAYIEINKQKAQHTFSSDKKGVFLTIFETGEWPSDNIVEIHVPVVLINGELFSALFKKKAVESKIEDRTEEILKTFAKMNESISNLEEGLKEIIKIMKDANEK